MDAFLSLFSYGFMTRALLVGIPVSLCAALLGVCLVLKRYSMIGDGLSHVGFGAMALAASLGLAPLQIAVPTVMIAAFFLLRLGQKEGTGGGDSAIAMISTVSLAVGVTAVSLSKGMNTDVNSYMFGSVYAIAGEDVGVSIALAVMVLVLFVLFYPRIFSVTFDETFAKATGVRVGIYNTVIAMLTAVTVVLGMRLMGTLLISALIVFPSLSAMRVCKSFFSMVLTAALISVVCFFSGIMISYFYGLPPGGSIVLTNLVAFLALSLIGKVARRR